jgi:hypothetical protein
LACAIYGASILAEAYSKYNTIKDTIASNVVVNNASTNEVRIESPWGHLQRAIADYAQ